MTTIRQAETDKDRALIRELFWEYLEWANGRLTEEYRISLDIPSILERDMDNLEVFLPPHGRLLRAIDGNITVGITCMRRIRQDIGEIKRMYVRPEFHGRGIGRSLLDALILEARKIGYPTLRLDSTRFMKIAHALYRSAGFHEIKPYEESEIPVQYQKHWIFMEKHLKQSR